MQAFAFLDMHSVKQVEQGKTGKRKHANCEVQRNVTELGPK